MTPAATGIFHTMRYTPMRDLLRGRLTARLDIEGRLDASELPQPARELIRRVVRRTRLWRLEKAAVADELIDHFAGGIEAGRTVEELTASFGDPRRAAKLIGRAKRRNRPLAWHAMILMRRLLIALVVVYALLAVYYHTGKPSPGIDYIGLLDRKIAQVPQDQRAWPIYREVIRSAEFMPYGAPSRKPIPHEVYSARPGDPQWPVLVDWLTEHTDALELARQASRKPALGLTIGPGGAWDDPVLHPPGMDQGRYKRQWPSDSTLLLNAPQLHLYPLSRMAAALAGDAYLARQQDDIDRFLRDVAAINGLADQLREHDLILPAGGMSMWFRELALITAVDALAAEPKALESSRLQRLAHLFAAPGSASEILNFESTRQMLHDLVQHMYSDNGSGSGRLTPQGVRFLVAERTDALVPKEMILFSWYFSDSRRALAHFRTAAAPLLPLLVASRRELLDAADRLIDTAQANLAKPWWQTDWEAFRRQLREWRLSPSARVKYAPLLSFFPALESAHAMAEKHLGQRDGLLVAIALEAYRQEQGQYPQSLDALTPALLPSVPADRMNGQPLRYRLVNGKPLVYSVGADGDDDDGRAPMYRGRPLSPYYAAPTAGASPPHDGDWLLWPPAP